jgi:ankyrin repeat protein
MASWLEDSSLVVALLAAIRSGDVDGLARLLRDNPLASRAVIERPCTTGPSFFYPLIAATTDWPGNYPRVAATIAALLADGADVNARCTGHHRETALHWAASCDDVAAIDALLDAGADIEAPGAVIAGGTPLDDAVAFAQWRAARRLCERGARLALWHAAALGLIERVRQHFAQGEPAARYPWGGARTARDAVQVAFWAACHGAQQLTAAYLLERGADPGWRSPWDGLTPIEAARRSGADGVVEWLESLAPGAASPGGA